MSYRSQIGMPQRIRHIYRYLIILIVCTYSLMSNKVLADVSAPDFAFPETVAKNANNNFEHAIHTGDSILMLRSLIDYITAEELITHENTALCLDRLMSAEAQTSGIVTRSLINLMRANVLWHYYQADRWTFMQRNLPVTPYPAQISMWSAEQFNDTISSLLDEALSCKPQLIKTPINSFKGIITADRWQSIYYPTLYDFIGVKALDILNDFRNYNKGDVTERLIKDLQASHGEGSAPYIMYTLDLNRDYTPDNLFKFYKHYEGCEYSGDILARISPYACSIQQKVNLASEICGFIDRYPNYHGVNTLKNNLRILTQAEANINIKSDIVAPSQPIDVDVYMQNTPNATLKIYKVNINEGRDYINSSDLISKTPVQTYTIVNDSISSDKNIPYYCTKSKTISISEDGSYAIVVSIPGCTPQGSAGIIKCTSLIGLELNNGKSFISVNSSTGKPMSGTKVIFNKRKSVKRNSTYIPFNIGTTDKDGILKSSNFKENDCSGYYTFSNGQLKYKTPVKYIYNPSTESEICDYNAIGYTSLGVYRQGDSVEYAFIVTNSNAKSVSPAKDNEIRIILYDKNYQPVDTVFDRTDDFGRINGKITIPTEGLTGYYSLESSIKDKNGAYITCGRKSFMVSDYKMPQFYVEVYSVRHDSPSDGDITLCGKAITYSGFPVAEATVQVGLSPCRRDRYWYGNVERQLTSLTVNTDQKGQFEIIFHKSLLDSTSNKSFKADIDVTSASGETQSCEKYFTKGSPYMIALDYNNQQAIDISSPVKIAVSVLDEQNLPVDNFSLTYSLTDNKNNIVKSGIFNVSDPYTDWSAIPQGTYRLSVEAADTSLAETAYESIILYDPSAKTTAVDSPLWLPTDKYMFNNGKADIQYSVSEGKSYIYALISDSEGNEAYRQFSASSGYHTFSISPLSATAENTYVTLICVRDCIVLKKYVTISNQDASRTINLMIESFRDRLIPGQQEDWKITAVDKNGRPVKSALLLDIYNKALDKVYAQNFSAPHFNTPNLGGFFTLFGASNYSVYNGCTSKISFLPTTSVEEPSFRDYGLGFGFNSLRNLSSGIRLRGAMVKAEAITTDGANTSGSNYMMDEAKVAYDNALEETEDAVAEDASEPSSKAQQQATSETVVYRPSEMPLMMFKPMITTDDNGTYSIKFTVPDANATWHMAVVSYNQELKSTLLQKDFITSKPLMVAPNAPRFIRIGDTVRILTSVMNATDSLSNIDVTTELFNPITNEVIKSEASAISVDANSSMEVSIDITATEDMSSIGYRIRAVSGNYSDGEQIAIPVLQSVAPVFESKPFYISSGTANYTLDIPDIPVDASVVLQYCDNPRWYVVSALPGLRKNAGKDANSAAAAIYSACVAHSLLNENPAIADAIREWNANPTDSMLVSMLERNSELKTTILNATPWVSDASDDTERMARLSLLFDKKEINKNIKDAIDVLYKLNAPSGGWMWFSRATEASAWTTQNVLGMMSSLKQMNCLPSDRKLNTMIESAVKWLDSKYAADYKKYGHPENYIDFVYVRDKFSEIPTSVGIQNLTGDVVQYIVRNWRNFDLGMKPVAAMILFSHSYKELAGQVLESMKQYSKHTPEKGMWFPSFDDRKPWWNMTKNIATALALDAFEAIEPGSKTVEALAQWLVLQKEAQNWGNSVATTQVVSSLLRSYTASRTQTGSAHLILGNTILEPSKIERLTGSFTMPISQYSPSGKQLHIDRNGSSLSQAFGAILYKYKDDPSNIKASSCEAVSINKRILRRVITDNGYTWEDNTESLAVGDRVKILLTIVADRDIEYVVINDDRAAAFEPVEQLPSFIFSEGIAFYKENLDSSTNFFISYMPKGTYLLEYELNVNNSGSFTSGIATLQSQYAPALSAHSSGHILKISF